MNNKKLITGVVVALGASAIAFSAYKLYKEVKRIKEDIEIIEDPFLEVDANRELKLMEAKQAAVEELWAEEDEFDREKEAMEYLHEDIKEELSILRYHQDSIEAYHQYMEMCLSDLDPHGENRVAMLELFNYMFLPKYDEDRTVMGHIVEKRIEFFGEGSKYNESVTIAELIFHFAYQFDFDFNGGVEHWVDMMLRNTGLTRDCLFDEDGDLLESYMDMTVMQVQEHELYRDGLFGLFGLPAVFSNWDGYYFLKQYHAAVEEIMSSGDYDDGGVDYEEDM